MFQYESNFVYSIELEFIVLERLVQSLKTMNLIPSYMMNYFTKIILLKRDSDIYDLNKFTFIESVNTILSRIEFTKRTLEQEVEYFITRYCCLVNKRKFPEDLMYFLKKIKNISTDKDDKLFYLNYIIWELSQRDSLEIDDIVERVE